MSRPIKFRAWDKEDKVMVEWEELKDSIDLGKLLYNEYGQYDEYEVMQYTGRKDKNGVEIFEGDIVEIVQPERRTTTNSTTGELWESKWENKTRSVVKWQDDNNPRWAGMLVWGKGTLEVIGNTFENPELLEGKAYD